MYVEPLNETRKIIEEKYPEYLQEFDKLHKKNICTYVQHVYNEKRNTRRILCMAIRHFI